jgi:glycosyltransferase involved in cell wall biosynthesis
MIAHLIFAIKKGGAEVAMLRSVRADDYVLCVTANIDWSLIETINPELRRNTSKLIIGVIPIIKFLGSRHAQTNVLAWMYRASWLGCLLSYFFPLLLVANIRHSLSSINDESVFLKIDLFLMMILKNKLKHIIFNSYYAKSTHEKYLKIKNFSIIYNYIPCVSSSHNKFFARGGIITVGFIARSHPMKNVRTFINLANLYADNEYLRFVVIGAGYHNKLQRSLINVEFLGAFSSQEKIFSQVDIVVSTSLYGESFQNVIFEALARGKPVIASNLAACSELLPSELLVDLDNNDPGLAYSVILDRIINYEKTVIAAVDRAVTKTLEVTAGGSYFAALDAAFYKS